MMVHPCLMPRKSTEPLHQLAPNYFTFTTVTGVTKQAPPDLFFVSSARELSWEFQ